MCTEEMYGQDVWTWIMDTLTAWVHLDFAEACAVVIVVEVGVYALCL